MICHSCDCIQRFADISTKVRQSRTNGSIWNYLSPLGCRVNLYRIYFIYIIYIYVVGGYIRTYEEMSKSAYCQMTHRFQCTAKHFPPNISRHLMESLLRWSNVWRSIIIKWTNLFMSWRSFHPLLKLFYSTEPRREFEFLNLLIVYVSNNLHEYMYVSCHVWVHSLKNIHLYTFMPRIYMYIYIYIYIEREIDR